MIRSSFAPCERHTRWCGYLRPTVSAISRRKNACPGATALHTKFNDPTKHWIWTKLAFGLPSKSWICLVSAWTLTWETRTCPRTASISSPKYEIVCTSPKCFACFLKYFQKVPTGLTGCPNKEKIIQIMCDKTWMRNLFHPEHPIGRHLSK